MQIRFLFVIIFAKNLKTPGSGSGELLHNLHKTGCNMQAQKAEQRTKY